MLKARNVKAKLNIQAAHGRDVQLAQYGECRDAHAGLQVSMLSDCDLCHPG